MRPVYCKKSDNEREIRRATKFVAFLKSTAPKHIWGFRMSEPFANYDATILRDGKAVAVIEVRDRFGDGSRHSHWHTAKLKVQRSMDAAAKLGLPLFLLVAWDEDTYWTEAKNLVGLPTHMSGRTDRNDPKDWEEMILMPKSIFKKY